MPLSSGTRLGPYDVVSMVGSGGMGEVYRARDRKLDREVAIKILPEALAADPERIARFEREAKTLAALNHPNIAHIYGLEESNGITALILELVEGPTLAEVLAQGSGLKASGPSRPEPLAMSRQPSGARTQGLPIDDALRIARPTFFLSRWRVGRFLYTGRPAQEGFALRWHSGDGRQRCA